MDETGAMRIIGHRGGAGGIYPENSIPAFHHAIKMGADGIELDVRLSRDNRVIVIHDATIDRVSLGSGEVAQLGAAELRSHALVDPSGTPHMDTRIPVLEELFEAVDSGTINIDLKTADTALARAVADIVRRYDAAHRTTIASFLPAAMEFFRSIAPDIFTSADPQEVKALVRARYARESVRTPARRVQIPPRYRLFPLATKGFVGYFHRHGLAVDVWTVNNPRFALKMAHIGVDALVTDDVAAIRHALHAGGAPGYA
ncbi:MAG: glycerophosphodiester phosphodiesterase family protein [Alkalispirochaeta sp.]